MLRNLGPLTLFFIGFSAVALPGHSPSLGRRASDAIASKMAPEKLVSEIAADYGLHVKAIFEEKCSSCHSVETSAPWYAKIPGVGSLVEQDRTEAKEHLEISKGFPFGGHGTNHEDLVALRASVTEGTMPPGLYRIVHPLSRLSTEEKAAVLRWLDHAEGLLK